MDIRDLMNRLEILEARSFLEEGLRLKDMIASIAGSETNDQERFKKIAELAKQNGLPGLYDPVSGQFIKTDGSTSNTADKETDKKLAYLGLIPDNAATSTYWGRVFGTSGKDYDAGIRDVSGKAVAAQDREEREVELLAELKRLVPKYLELKRKTALARKNKKGGAAGQTAKADPTTPSKVQKLSNGTELRTYSDGKQIIYDPNKKTDYAGSIPGNPGTYLVGTKDKPYTIPADVKVVNESLDIASALIESFGYTGIDEDWKDDAVASGIGMVTGAILTSKWLSKPWPGVGAGYSAVDAYDRFQHGDIVGAGLSGLSGALCLIPGVGWFPALIPDFINAWRDYKGYSKQNTLHEASESKPNIAFFLKNGRGYMLLPNGYVFDQSANLVDGRTLQILKTPQELVAAIEGKKVNEGPIGQGIVKVLTWVGERIGKFVPEALKKVPAAEKAAAEAGAKSTAKAGSELGEKVLNQEVKYQGKTYRWLGQQWAEVNPATGKAGSIARREIVPKLDKVAKRHPPVVKPTVAEPKPAVTEPVSTANTASTAAKPSLLSKIPGGTAGKIAGTAATLGGAKYAWDEWNKSHPNPADDEAVPSDEVPAAGETPAGGDSEGPGGAGTGASGGRAGQDADSAADDKNLSPEERAQRSQDAADLEDFDEIKQRIKEIIDELSKSQNPEIRKQLANVREQLMGVGAAEAPAEKPAEVAKESTDVELARWLKIARG